MKKKKKQELEAATGNYASAIGIGLVAGLFGTAVMTAAQMIEMKLTGRKPSDTPYQAVKKVFDIQARNKEDKAVLSNIIHWVYGSSWGIPRGLLAEAGATGVTGTAAHFSGVWGTEITMLPSLDVSEPITEWKPSGIAKDVALHALYAVATGVAADYLTRWSHRQNKKVAKNHNPRDIAG